LPHTDSSCDAADLPPVVVISEATAARLIGIEDAITAVESALASLDSGISRAFTFSSGQGPGPGTRLGVKAGYDGLSRHPGAKLGSYWSENSRTGLANHGSTTLLLDDRTGRPCAFVAASYLTALRTAAADAVAVKHLARASASRLSILGSGHQAYYEALAVAQVRQLDQISIWGRDPAAAARLALRLRDAGLPARAVEIEEAVTQADILCTVTASTKPLFDAALATPGIHISAMGADGPGKQELPSTLVESALLFTDLVTQSIVIGEFQHACRSGRIDPDHITPLGAVINGTATGRTSDSQTTIFDSSGVAVQDIAIAALALARARDSGMAHEIEF
jgi:ornithine cyclodeaminase